jgi:hypothetical protein
MSFFLQEISWDSREEWIFWLKQRQGDFAPAPSELQQIFE